LATHPTPRRLACSPNGFRAMTFRRGVRSSPLFHAPISAPTDRRNKSCAKSLKLLTHEKQLRKTSSVDQQDRQK
jgi:hypothetical protein